MEFDVMMSMNPAANAVNSTHNFKVTAVNVANGTASGTPLTLGTVKTTSANTKNVTFNVKQGDSTAKAGENKILAKVEIIFDHA
jgi:predicted aspartyl protease